MIASLPSDEGEIAKESRDQMQDEDVWSREAQPLPSEIVVSFESVEEDTLP